MAATGWSAVMGRRVVINDRLLVHAMAGPDLYKSVRAHLNVARFQSFMSPWFAIARMWKVDLRRVAPIPIHLIPVTELIYLALDDAAFGDSRNFLATN